MRAHLCCVALVLGMVPAAALAQDGLRSASLPERSLRREDVFRTRPDTYRPDPNRPPLPVFGYLAPQMVYPLVQPIIVVVPRDVADPARVHPRVPPAPVAPPAPYVAGLPGRPKNFYVIPGCYAGDRRPEPESLAPGCSMTRRRVVAPS